MKKANTAKLFRNGRSQAVRLPKEFRFEGDRVRIRRVAQGVLLQPFALDVSQWFAEMDRAGSRCTVQAFHEKGPQPTGHASAQDF